MLRARGVAPAGDEGEHRLVFGYGGGGVQEAGYGQFFVDGGATGAYSGLRR
jgi:hypothetical protein